jgi:hypothetical protein
MVPTLIFVLIVTDGRKGTGDTKKSDATARWGALILGPPVCTHFFQLRNVKYTYR